MSSSISYYAILDNQDRPVALLSFASSPGEYNEDRITIETALRDYNYSLKFSHTLKMVSNNEYN